MRYTRLVPLVAALVLALAPVTTFAASATVTLENKHRANVLNDIARCQLAAAGAHLPGNVAASQPEAVVGCAAGARALQTLPGAAGKCPVTGRGTEQVRDESDQRIRDRAGQGPEEGTAVADAEHRRAGADGLLVLPVSP